MEEIPVCAGLGNSWDSQAGATEHRRGAHVGLKSTKIKRATRVLNFSRVPIVCEPEFNQVSALWVAGPPMLSQRSLPWREKPETGRQGRTQYRSGPMLRELQWD